jgi:hypothetical protein
MLIQSRYFLINENWINRLIFINQLTAAFNFFFELKNFFMFVVSSSFIMCWRLSNQFAQKRSTCLSVCRWWSQMQFENNTMKTRRKKNNQSIRFVSFSYAWRKKFFNFVKSLCNFIFLNVMFVISVSQTLRRFRVWYARYMSFHFVRKNLMKILSNETFFLLFFSNSLIHIFSVYLILRSINVSWAFRLRRSRVSNKRCLICSQKSLINVSCLWFFMRCLNDIYKRIMCNWINWTWIFVSRICIEIALKLSLITRKFCCWSLSSFFVVATTLFERSCDAYQIIKS